MSADSPHHEPTPTERRLQERIHDLERQLDDLHRRYTHLEQSLQTTPLAVVEWDLAGTIQRWNASATQIFGWTAAEALGQNTFTLMIDADARDQVEQIKDAIVRGHHATSRNANITKDGRTITCQWFNAPIYAADGAVIGILSQAQDMTAQLATEHALRRAEQERQHYHQNVIAAQAAALRELSTPLIPIASKLVVMPLIGALDTRRAQQMTETLLEGISAQRAEIAILDITGVPILDIQVANALLHAAQAVQLLGAQVLLTGIRPDVAQTLVSLGVNLEGIITRNTLQDGVAYALRQQAG